MTQSNPAVLGPVERQVRPSAMHSTPERTVMLRRMRDASNVFYGLAVQAGCHPFIEFTGLINEYINCCEEASANGIDFSRCNTHEGQSLPMHPHQVDYANEKLECIFTGRSVLQQDGGPNARIDRLAAFGESVSNDGLGPMYPKRGRL